MIMPVRSAVTEPRPYALPDDPDLPYGRGELTALMPPSLVRSVLGDWHPFPTVDEREPWRNLPDQVRDRSIETADQALNEPWPDLRASVFADFQRNGNRSRFELSHFGRRRILRDLVLGAGLTAEDRFTDPIMDAVWSISEESFWGVPAHSFSRRHVRLPLPATDEPVIDLFAAETGAQLAWTRYLMGDRLIAAGGDAFDARVVGEIDRRLITPLLERDDWFWLSQQGRTPNNWNPWVCSNLLVATLFTENDADRRAAVVSKIIAALDAYVDQLLPDGGCSEGQSYWAVGPAKLLDCLDALRGASDGQLDGFALPAVAALSRYPVAMHVDGRDMIQHADGHGQWLLESSVLHRAGRLLGDPQAEQLSIFLRDAANPRPERARTNLWRGLSEIFEPGFLEAPATDAPLIKERWFPDLQVLVAREQQGSSDGFLLCMKAGHNAEHHNQNDVGGLSIAVDGHPLIVDPGVGVYSKKTFSPQRYELWEMNSDWHCLPIIDGTVQSAGAEFAARSVQQVDDDQGVSVSAELIDAWPSGTGMDSYRRTARLDRARRQVVITDVWQGNGSPTVVLPLTCAREPRIDGSAVTFGVAGSSVTLRVDGATSIRSETKQLDDPNLIGLWGPELWRLLITPQAVDHGRLELTFTR
ncbi:heparinase II/III domain-containing protein [Microlunatus soli]|uniref:Heparinase II/III-like protein n=1 Tax=Microlunatus soli TaxID=630515 RepID=A0A1H2AFK3_9ACTN|nr:heparinase II/III family protein [Microlunatus soli]SDT44276.1 Heparinase II/III-like protein [Microlunatus soli]